MIDRARSGQRLGCSRVLCPFRSRSRLQPSIAGSEISVRVMSGRVNHARGYAAAPSVSRCLKGQRPEGADVELTRLRMRIHEKHKRPHGRCTWTTNLLI
jgi:hypothetical protein